MRQSGFAHGNYTIAAVVDPVPDETDTSDNTLSFNTVHVSVPGDVNGNGHVSMMDLYLMAVRYGARIVDPSYVRNCNIEDDGAISMLDLYHAALCFGHSGP